MRAFLATPTLISAALMSTAPLHATTVTVHNRSGEPVRLSVNRSPSGYEAHLRPVMEPGVISSVRRPNTKVLMPHESLPQAVFEISYLDGNGRGCRFFAAPERHSAAFARVRPAAEPVRGGRCEAGVGSTVGDFVFTVR